MWYRERVATVKSSSSPFSPSLLSMEMDIKSQGTVAFNATVMVVTGSFTGRYLPGQFLIWRCGIRWHLPDMSRKRVSGGCWFKKKLCVLRGNNNSWSYQLLFNKILMQKKKKMAGASDVQNTHTHNTQRKKSTQRMRVSSEAPVVCTLHNGNF